MSFRAEKRTTQLSAHPWPFLRAQAHSRPQRSRSFSSAPRIVTYGKVQFSDHAQRIRFDSENETGWAKFGYFKMVAPRAFVFRRAAGQGERGSVRQ